MQMAEAEQWTKDFYEKRGWTAYGNCIYQNRLFNGRGG